VLLVGFIYAHVTTFREAFRDDDRPPFELFDYAGYTTPPPFHELDALTNELKSRAYCRWSLQLLHRQPMRF